MHTIGDWLCINVNLSSSNEYETFGTLNQKDYQQLTKKIINSGWIEWGYTNKNGVTFLMNYSADVYRARIINDSFKVPNLGNAYYIRAVE